MPSQPPDSTQVAHDWAARNLPGWPVERQVLAAHLVTRYGDPQEMTAGSLTWHDNGSVEAHRPVSGWRPA